jgi:neurotransmitter:Na+ symporter, NSS family
MAGNAVGLGNFLRFPTQAAVHGGGSFMVPYFIALLLVGIPLMWIEWGVGRHGGRYRKGHLPGMFAALWRHPLAKYLGVVGLVVPLAVMTYYTYLESWTLAFAVASAGQDYFGATTPEAMLGYLQSFQGVTDTGQHRWWTPYAYFTVAMGINVWVLSRGIRAGIERLALVGMPLLFLCAVVLAVVIARLPAGPDGSTALTGYEFIYRPELARLAEPNIWLAAAGQVFFTLSVGMGTLQAYASYLRPGDDITLSGLATAATNETAEVVLGGSIAIPAAVVFFGVSGAMAIAQSGAFNLGFVTMPVVFQQVHATLPIGHLLGVLWFGLLFLAGVTSSVAMLTPLVAFLREEFGLRREVAAWGLGALCWLLGLLHVHWLKYGFLDEWDYWAGTFGLVLVAVIETVLFMWVFTPEKAWASIHEGADLPLWPVFKFIMTYLTPLFLLVILFWWGKEEALPILWNQRAAGGGAPVTAEAMPYVTAARALLLLLVVTCTVLVRLAWRRNGYDDRAGFAPAAAPEAP